MSFEYKPTKAEQKAEALLKQKGWSVSPPTCPECHGMGWIARWSTWTVGTNPLQSISSGSRPCPNGCPYAAMYYSSFAGTSTTVVADGTVGMRRGE